MNFYKNPVAGSVILYNSDLKVLKNIQTYLGQVACVYIIDNSETVNSELINQLNSLPNIVYIANDNNMGVAYALNQAANMALGDGYQYLLTMDDDTALPDGAVQAMLGYANQNFVDNLGIITGQYNKALVENTVTSVPYTITSGNLLCLSAYQACGPFMNELFIDLVDYEYCFRLTNNNYKIIEMNNIHISHRLGEKKQLKLINKKLSIRWVSHNYLRVYYKTRNSIVLIRRHNFMPFSMKWLFCKEILKDLFKISFLEGSKKKDSFFLLRQLPMALVAV